MKPLQHQHVLYIYIFATLLLVGCAKSFNPDIKRGSSYNFKEGFPEVRFSSIGTINNDGEPELTLNANIVYGSLIYKEKNNSQEANIVIDIQIIAQDENNSDVQTKRYPITITKDNPNISYSQKTFSFEKQLPIEPGKYEIKFTLTDLTSKKKITNTSQTYVPNLNAEKQHLTNISMLGKNVGAEQPNWSPVITYDVPAKIDSLKFVIQATNNSSENPMTINTNLIRFKSDTSAARPMHYSNYSPSSIEYKGINYDKEEVIESTQRKLIQAGNVLIEFTFSNQRRGNYRFEVTSNKNEETEEAALYKARDFGIKSKHYPSVQSARELAAPLVYLMGEKSHKKLMKIQNSDSLKKEVDRFWLRNIRNTSKARSVIEKYYQRVEEANKQFSNFKEGWKTDPGMIYILFGPPWYVNQSLDEMKWSFSYNRSDPERNFFFYQPKLESKFFPFQHFLLDRSQSYFSVRYQQAELWLTGLILQRNL